MKEERASSGTKVDGADRTVGFVTIGQSPRPDILEEMQQLLNQSGSQTGWQILERGALDGLSRKAIGRLAPEAGEDQLLTRLANGTSVVVGKQKIVPRINAAVANLEARGAEIVALLCTEEFAGLRSAKRSLLVPWELLQRTLTAILPSGKAGVLVPLESQRESMRRRWERATGLAVVVESADPYADAVDWQAVGQRFAESGASAVVLDCIGYSGAVCESLFRGTGKPVLAPRHLLAAWILMTAE